MNDLKKNINKNYKVAYNTVEFDICETQGRIYEIMAINGYDMKLSSDLYLHSDFCRRYFDTIYSRFQVADAEESIDFIIPEIKDKIKVLDDNKEFSPKVAYWIGFTYRQLYMETDIPSNELGDKISFEKMCAYYPGLHTIDENMASDIICMNFNLTNKSHSKNINRLKSQELEM